jgi:hypothetical protein
MVHGSPVSAEWWIHDVLLYKERHAESVAGKKLIILSGSNSLFGIESLTVEKFIGFPVVNLSTHAQLELDFLKLLLERHLNKGDVVVMPLEFEYYRRDYDLSDWYAANMVAWGKESYLDHLDSLEYFHFISQVPKRFVWNGLQYLNKPSKLSGKDTIIDTVLKNNSEGRAPFAGYSYLSLNRQGDILAEIKPNKYPQLVVRDGDDFKTSISELSPYFIKDYGEIQDLVKEREATLILTWPATIRNKLFDMSLKEHQENIATLTKQLKDQNISILCEPGLFNMSYHFFSNSRYHLNAKGARMRSIMLGDCLRSLLTGETVKDIDDDIVVSKLKQLEAKFARFTYPLEP